MDEVGRLDEAVLVVGQRGQVDKPFDERVDQLDEQAERADAGHVAVELLADLVRHETDLLPLHQLPLRLGRPPLPLRRVLRRSREARLRARRAAARRPLAAPLAQQPVHHEIGIPPDRRGEVRIDGHRETEVAGIRRVVPGLLHRAQHQERDGPFDGGARHAVDELLEVPRPHGAAGRPEGVAERGDEGVEDLDLRRVGRLVDAVDGGHAASLEFRRDSLVGEQHELFDQAVRVVALRGGDGLDLPLVVEPDLGLRQVEVNRPPAPAPLAEPFEQTVHRPQHRDNRRIGDRRRTRLPRQDGVHARVRQAGAAPDDAVVEHAADGLAARIEIRSRRTARAGPRRA